ncbi:hypothetical protein G3M48_000496 [Beauveria asiatica]|uniref:Uncharacterized protein n=1 Tax=Beauveria asiatica TaxID=1069075 RepID=A0AAW0S7M8_9HYPO
MGEDADELGLDPNYEGEMGTDTSALNQTTPRRILTSTRKYKVEMGEDADELSLDPNNEGEKGTDTSALNQTTPRRIPTSTLKHKVEMGEDADELSLDPNYEGKKGTNTSALNKATPRKATTSTRKHKDEDADELGLSLNKRARRVPYSLGRCALRITSYNHDPLYRDEEPDDENGINNASKPCHL